MYENILVGTDGSETATRAVTAAAEIASRCGARLHVGVAYSGRMAGMERAEFEQAPTEYRWRLTPGAVAEAVGEQAVSAACQAATEPIEVEVHCVLARPVEGVVELATRLDVDLVVVGNRGMAGTGRILGSVPRAVAQRAPCAVLIVDTVGRRRRRRAA
jgi:nucleotide-binding universal stress UspA family protein